MAHSSGDNGDREESADVTASDLAAFAYCAKAWHLERVLGTAPTTSAAVKRNAGVAAHAQHGRHTMVQDDSRRYGRTAIGLLLLAALFILLAIVAG
jgi:hypothetical protein